MKKNNQNHKNPTNLKSVFGWIFLLRLLTEKLYYILNILL